MMTQDADVKQKKCKACRKMFRPFNSLQKACSPKCALDLVEEKKAKDRRKQINADKKALRESDRGWWIEQAQREFNKWIRNRDANQPCISCGENRPSIQYAAGHYRTVGACPELRFEELNCHKQCNRNCNQHRSGNIGEYRIGLRKRIGDELLEWLEGPHKPKHYTIEDLREIRDKYRKLNKEF